MCSTGLYDETAWLSFASSSSAHRRSPTQTTSPPPRWSCTASTLRRSSDARAFTSARLMRRTCT
uniref:Uncharacterized protein n=1 Tax=Zea mays TaxID=4577 RepID=C4J2X8_MAIZE|nr:unknown [Zea mays]